MRRSASREVCLINENHHLRKRNRELFSLFLGEIENGEQDRFTLSVTYMKRLLNISVEAHVS